MTDALVCARCQPLEALVAQLEAEKLDLIRENTELGNEINGLQHTLRKLGAEIMHLRREMRQTLEQEDGADVVRGLLEHWAKVTGRTARKGRKADLSVSGKRGQVVKKALRMQNVHTRAKYTPQELREALDGLALLPYVGKGRQAKGTPSQRYDDIEHALRDEPTIDRFREYARRAAAAADQPDPWGFWEVFQQLEATAQQYMDLAIRAAAARQRASAAVEPVVREAA